MTTERLNPEDVAWLKDFQEGQIVPIKGYQERQADRIARIRKVIGEMMPDTIPVTDYGMMDLKAIPQVADNQYAMHEIRKIISEAAGFSLMNVYNHVGRKRMTRAKIRENSQTAGFYVLSSGGKKETFEPIWTYAGEAHDRKYCPEVAWQIEQALLFAHSGRKSGSSRVYGPILATGLAWSLIDKVSIFTPRHKNIVREILQKDDRSGDYGMFPRGFEFKLSLTKNLIDAKFLSYDEEYEFTGATFRLYRKMAEMIPEAALQGAIGKRICDILHHEIFTKDMRKITSARRGQDARKGKCIIFGVEAPKDAYVVENDHDLMNVIEGKPNENAW